MANVVASISVPLQRGKTTDQLLETCIREKKLRVSKSLFGYREGAWSSGIVVVDVLNIFPLIPESARDFGGRISQDVVLAKLREMGYRCAHPREVISIAALGLGWPADPKEGKRPGELIAPTWLSLTEFRRCGSGQVHILALHSSKKDRHVTDFWAGSGFDARHLFLAVAATKPE